MVPHRLKSNLPKYRILSPPATSHFSYDLTCSLNSHILNLLRIPLTHNADPRNCLCTCNLLFLGYPRLSKLYAWYIRTSSFQSQPQNHLSMKPPLTFLPIHIKHHLFYAASETHTFSTLYCDHNLAGVTNTNTHRDQPGSINKVASENNLKFT